MWLLHHTFFALGLLVFARTSEICKPKACQRRQDTSNAHSEKPVCGSDGFTYPNRCQFEKAKCQQPNLTLTRKGPCKSHRPCLESVRYANQHPGYSFKPQCRPDGSYAASQCHPDTGHCWCVTPSGVPLPNTTVIQQVRNGRTTKHRCKRQNNHPNQNGGNRSNAKVNVKSRKRSPSKKNARNHHGKPCKHSDKSQFNHHLIGMFLVEWQKEKQTSMSANDSVVVEWKFDRLDLNGDGKLVRNEYRDFRRTVKNAVKPKRCGRTFFRSCDLNADQVIEKNEWADCLAINGMDEGRGGGNTSTDSDEWDEEEESQNSPTGHQGASSSSSNRSPPHGVLSQETNPMSHNYEDDSSEIREEEPANCLSDRQTALSEGSQLYIPECTSDGRYQKVQCYKSAGYCWCVNEDTGKNIPGTSVKNATPKCDELLPANRPMKGCPEEKKNAFLRDLIQFLHAKISSDGNNGTSTSSGDLIWKVSREELTAKLSFGMFDKNKNKMLDRNEWKLFKDVVLQIKTLRKCGKKLPRYCDINKDRQISMTEWLLCLNVQQQVTVMSPDVATNARNVTSSRFGKKNPLNMLKAD